MTVTNTGKAEMAELLIGAGTAFDSVAIGTGATEAFAATDTQLVTETGRESATTSTQTTDVTGDTSQFVATFNFTATGTINEVGIFNNSTGGTMLAAQQISDVNVQNGDSLQITGKIDFD